MQLSTRIQGGYVPDVKQKLTELRNTTGSTLKEQGLETNNANKVNG